MAVQHELSWTSVRGGEAQEPAPFLKLQTGENRIRIVGNPSLIDIHWEKGLDGQAKKIICPGKGCPICKVGHAPQSRYQIQVIDRTDGKVKILEGGVTIFNQIKECAMDEDFGDPTQYDFKIKKEGTGRETKYSLRPNPKKIPLSPEELELVAASRKLSDINKTKTIEEILQLGLDILADSMADLSDLNDNFDEPVKAKSNTATTKAATTSTAKLTDEEIDSEWDEI